jgi:DNA-binding NarL/FixJ family response regulator
MKSDSGQQSRLEAQGLRYFLVEDSALIRQNLVATLEEMLGLQLVGFAEDQASAMAWLATGEHVDLMIFDIFLKSGTGLEVLRQAQLLQPLARRVVLTNYATPDMRQRCTELGAHRVFDKSAELDELLAYCEALTTAGAD